jgi:Protein of unknown function (DUF664)
VTDLKPPKTNAGELETLMTALQFQRDSFVRKVSGISDEQARRRLVPSDTTLLWLTEHVRYAEIIWFRWRFAGEDVDLPSDMRMAAASIDEAVDAYRDEWPRLDEIVLGASGLDRLCVREPGEAVNLRWVVTHLIEEIARHAGHADILRELVDGETGR